MYIFSVAQTFVSIFSAKLKLLLLYFVLYSCLFTCFLLCSSLFTFFNYVQACLHFLTMFKLIYIFWLCSSLFTFLLLCSSICLYVTKILMQWCMMFMRNGRTSCDLFFILNNLGMVLFEVVWLSLVQSAHIPVHAVTCWYLNQWHL